MEDTLRLNSGGRMPMIGLGTSDPMHEVPAPGWIEGRFPRLRRALYGRVVYRSRRLWRGRQLSRSVKEAIEAGYRMIDTSAAYGNEAHIGRGIRWSGLPREEIFLITRISNRQQWAGDVRGALLASLRSLGTEYVDLYMFHWPVPDAFVRTWREMEKLQREGLARAIGVANCHRHHLEALLAAGGATPAVNEFEIHPLMSQDELVGYCRSKGIAVIAYTPIGRFHEKLAGSPVLNELAARHGKSIPQVILRWHLQRKIAAIPRSVNPRHIRANVAIYDFALSEDEMLRVGGINENLRLRHDPDNCDFTKL